MFYRILLLTNSLVRGQAVLKTIKPILLFRDNDMIGVTHKQLRQRISEQFLPMPFQLMNFGVAYVYVVIQCTINCIIIYSN